MRVAVGGPTPEVVDGRFYVVQVMYGWSRSEQLRVSRARLFGDKIFFIVDGHECALHGLNIVCEVPETRILGRA